MIRFFLDANVLFSAALTPDGRARALFDLATDSRSKLTLLASPYSFDEAERNLALKQSDRVAELRKLARRLSITAEAGPAIVRWAIEQGLPPQDAPILAAAVQSRADFLVTADRKHFGGLYEARLRGVVIVSPAAAVALVLERG